MKSPHILDVNPLLGMWFAGIVPSTLGHLFSVLLASFAEQESCLMWSHLFILLLFRQLFLKPTQDFFFSS